MTKLEAIATTKQFRKDADEILQRMKKYSQALKEYVRLNSGYDNLVDGGEVIAQHIISTRDLESCIMRQGMALKYMGQPNPYPQSYNPSNTVVEPTADGLKL